ncbi:MAG: glutamate-5-semialdehyde dehydrogenase [Bulleidia sp.]
MTTTEEILQNALIEKQKPVPSEEQLNQALLKMADRLIEDQEEILRANEEDIAAFGEKLGPVRTDRLRLTEARISDMAEGLRHVAELPCPFGEILEERTLDSGIHLKKVRVPMGVVAVIYESRPNVTSDSAGLLLKSGNVAVLRSGKESWHTSDIIIHSMQKALEETGIPGNRVQLIQDVTHDSARALMKAEGKIDLLIPRGGKNLIQTCVRESIVPVIETGTGICHIFVDEDADQEQALKIIENAKCSRPSVCNAEEVLLVHEAIASEFLPKLKEHLVDQRIARNEEPVELRLDPAAAGIIPGTPVGPDDFDTEFLDYILAVHVVKDIEEAISHISRHSTHHSEAILTRNQEHMQKFLDQVDSACVYVNASTRFTDGGIFGLGCEIGISTQKLHARGPMGLKELCTWKYELIGEGQIR